MWPLALLVPIAAAYAGLLAHLRRVEPRAPVWHGYARDGANLAAAAATTCAFVLAGFPGAVALLLGVVLPLAVYLIDWLVGKRLALAAAPAISFAAFAALAAVALGEHEAVAAAGVALLRIAQPRS